MSLVPQKFKAQDAQVIDVTLSGSVIKGQPAVINDIFGVYMNDGVSGQVVPFLIRGAIDLAKASGAVNQGQALFFNAGNGLLTTDSAGGTRKYAGNAALPAASGDAAVRCILNYVGNVTVVGSTLGLALGTQDDDEIELTATFVPGGVIECIATLYNGDMGLQTGVTLKESAQGTVESGDNKVSVYCKTNSSGVLNLTITEAASATKAGFLLVTPLDNSAPPQIIDYAFIAWT
jgi:predicted RecA/RadA family phage recombinase